MEIIHNKRIYKSLQVFGLSAFALFLVANSKHEENVQVITPDVNYSAMQDISIAEYIVPSINSISDTFTQTASIEEVEKCAVTAPNTYTLVAGKNMTYYADQGLTQPVGEVYFNQSVSYMEAAADVGVIHIDDNVYYIRISELCETNNYEEYIVVPYPGTKTIESYTAFGKNTPQWKLQQSATDDELGFRRINNRYLVALGSRFTESVGQYFDLVLANGTVIPCILSDQKADVDTDSSRTYTITNGSYCCSEFCVDLPVIKSHGIDGDASVFNGWNSRVAAIRVYDFNYFTN